MCVSPHTIYHLSPPKKCPRTVTQKTFGQRACRVFVYKSGKRGLYVYLCLELNCLLLLLMSDKTF